MNLSIKIGIVDSMEYQRFLTQGFKPFNPLELARETENIDFKTLLKECKNSKYYGPFILELFPYENILKGKERLFNFWNQL